MRDFFINTLDKLIAVIIVVAAIAVVVGALSSMVTQGFLAGLVLLVLGGLYVLMMGGMLYLFLGIYYNTKRTAEAVERMGSSA